MLSSLVIEKLAKSKLARHWSGYFSTPESDHPRRNQSYLAK